MADQKPYENITVVVTGASSGFGKGVVRRLAEGGANVVAAARRKHLLDELAAECGPNNVMAVETDVSKEEDIVNLVDAANRKFDKIDVWINNAAVGTIGVYDEVPLADLRRMVEINVHGTIYGSHYALRLFEEQGKGTLINLSSVSANVAFPYYTPYSASKYAVTGLSDALHEEMAMTGRDDIHVCTVYPWATDTPWFEHTANYTGHLAEMKPMDDPEIVIDAIIDLIDNPKQTVNVGMKTKGTTASSKVAAGMTEKMNARQVLKVIKDAPPAGPTSGSLHNPMLSGTEVDGGIRARMKAEKSE
ncbi:SDR family NAD(P)-dependent oxidoreductase [Planococcus sp. CAU13]|uniref:SDR family NAD(P)-dependent oxidoreductase n=1 Tax=Planococcus sp. CAU13 TaxID=1541197 RepID=UPI0005300588|nr:SDR family NAD(P)-dependent oxidoreductase [Planococcus sp. CAU13]